LILKNTLQLQLAFHHHQPVGNFNEVLEDCYRKAYLPLMESLLSRPNLKVHLSYSGPLLEFLRQSHPEYLDLIRALVKEKRVEFIATGFYEPVLVDISREDRLGQMEKNCRWIEEAFGCRPRGAWLAEAVWKTSLCATFQQLGLDYTLIRAERFLQAGISPAELRGHYFTEYLGNTLALFPVDTTLREIIPFGNDEEALTYLRRQANRRKVVLTYADVAERWGIWPGTYEKIQESGMGDRWFDLIANQEWIETRFFSQALRLQAPQGRCYLPEGAPIDLGIWSLPDKAREHFNEARDQLALRHDRERFLPYFRAGSWEGFRARYGEAHLMAKKGIWLRNRQPAGADFNDRFVDYLWGAQCNTAYWHGTSGGIYLPHLRSAIWEKLLSAQRLLDEGQADLQVEFTDFTADGIEEIVIYNSEVSSVISPADGGAVVELSLLRPLLNLSNTLTRRREESGPDTGRESLPPTDAYERHWFHEHFYPRQLTVRQLSGKKRPDLGTFAGGRYRLIASSQEADGFECVLERVGKVDIGGEGVRARVRKTYGWSQSGKEIRIDYQVINEGNVSMDGIFASEVNALLSSSGPGGRGQSDVGDSFALEGDHYEKRCRELSLVSEDGKIRLHFSSRQVMSLWSYPIRTSGGSVVARQPHYQGSSIVFGWDYAIDPGAAADFNLSLQIEVKGGKKIS
jgi:hypothetical protein